jgi:hypothetical protein
MTSSTRRVVRVTKVALVLVAVCTTSLSEDGISGEFRLEVPEITRPPENSSFSTTTTPVRFTRLSRPACRTSRRTTRVD